MLLAAPARWAEGTASPPRAATAASSSSSSLRHLQVTAPACPEPLSIQAPALARHLGSAQRSRHISLYRAYGPWQGHPTSDPCPQPHHHPNCPACTEPAARPVCCLLHRGLCRWHTNLCPKAFQHSTVPWHRQLLSLQGSLLSPHPTALPGQNRRHKTKALRHVPAQCRSRQAATRLHTLRPGGLGFGVFFFFLCGLSFLRL